MSQAQKTGVIRFGVFEVEPGSGILRKQGVRIRLQEQPFQVLLTLVERPGEIVTREELKQKIWAGVEFGDCDHSLNIAVNKIREALRDSAETPRYIETLPRRGYRFIGPLEMPLRSEPAPLSPGAQAAVGQPRQWQWLWPLAAIAPMLALALVWWLREPRGARELRAIPLASYPGYQSSPALSPDAKRLAFVWNGDTQDSFQIYVVEIGEGTPVRITNHAGSPSSLAWSPDDRYIAFLRKVEGERADLVLVPPFGGPERKLAEISIGELSLCCLSWTPDTRWLAFSAHNSPGEPDSIWAFSMETGERRRLTFPRVSADAMGDWNASFSPDGRMLAFGREEKSFVSYPWVLSLSSDLRPEGEPRRLGDRSYARLGGIAWVPGGREIVFGAGAALAKLLWRLDVSGRSDPLRLPCATEDASQPVIVGHRLVYLWYRREVNLWRLDTHTGERKLLIHSGSAREHRIPQYSPDGRRIAFQSTRSGNIEIWRCDADGSNCLQLTSFRGPQLGRPRWSPDGQSITFDCRANGEPGAYVVAADGGRPRLLASDATVPSWSRDGRWIYFASSRSGSLQIWKTPAAGGTAVQVTRNGGRNPIESADGKYLYYNRSPFRYERFPPSVVDSLLRMPVGGGEEVEVIPHVYCCFNVTARGVYFMPDPYTIRLLDPGSGTVTTVATLGQNVLGAFCVSPDDRFVVWGQEDRRSSELMLVDDFQ